MDQSSATSSSAATSSITETVLCTSSSAATSSITETVLCTQSSEEMKQQLVLRLKLDNEEKKKGVQWEEGTIDNEHLCRKSSKRCCIFHRRKAFAESDSDESDSDIEEAERKGPKPGAPKNFQRHHA